MKYDEQILLKGAQEFNREADIIVVICALRYGFFGLLFGAIGTIAIARTWIPDMAPLTLYTSITVVAGIGAACGIRRGHSLAFKLRLEAQRLIALVQIVHNTNRKDVPVAELV